MASNYWIKLYHEILDDPKMGRLSDRLWRRTIEMFLLAGEMNEDGLLPSLGDMAWRLRANEEELGGELEYLCTLGILSDGGEYRVVNFAERQAAMSSTERTRRQREADSNPKYSRGTWQARIWKSVPAEMGVYAIEYGATGKQYVGGSKNMQNRVRQHLSEIKSGIHGMSEDYETHGHHTLAARCLEVVQDEASLPAIEKKWIESYSADDLYNSDPGKRHRSWDRGGTNRPIDTDTDIDTEIDIEEETEAESVAALQKIGFNKKDIPKYSQKGAMLVRAVVNKALKTGKNAGWVRLALDDGYKIEAEYWPEEWKRKRYKEGKYADFFED